MADQLARVKEIIAENLDIDVTEISDNTNLIEDLGADSLDAVEIIMAIEEEFDIEIEDEKAQQIQTIQDIIKFIDELK